MEPNDDKTILPLLKSIQFTPESIADQEFIETMVIEDGAGSKRNWIAVRVRKWREQYESEKAATQSGSLRGDA